MEKKKKSIDKNSNRRISSNNLNERNRSQYKIKLGSNNNTKKGNRQKGNILLNTLYNLPPIKNHNTKKTIPPFPNSYDIQTGKSSEKESLELQLYYTRNEMEQKMSELTELLLVNKSLEESNKTFKVIIEKILKGEKFDEKTPCSEYGFMKITVLKNQNSICDKKIKEKTKELENINKVDKINNFKSLNQEINEINKNLEKLVEESQKIQYYQQDIEIKKNAYIDDIKKEIDKTSSLEAKIKANENEEIYAENQLQNYEKQKEEANLKFEKTENEYKKMEESRKNNKEIISDLNNDLEKNSEYIKEMEKNENSKFSIEKHERNLKINIKRNEKILSNCQKENSLLIKEKSNLEEEIEKLNQEIKSNNLNKQNKKTYLKKINDLKNKNQKNSQENKNQLYVTEISQYENEKNKLLNEINSLKQELNSKNEENQKLEKQYAEII